MVFQKNFFFSHKKNKIDISIFFSPHENCILPWKKISFHEK